MFLLQMNASVFFSSTTSNSFITQGNIISADLIRKKKPEKDKEDPWIWTYYDLLNKSTFKIEGTNKKRRSFVRSLFLFLFKFNLGWLICNFHLIAIFIEHWSFFYFKKNIISLDKFNQKTTKLIRKNTSFTFEWYVAPSIIINK